MGDIDGAIRAASTVRTAYVGDCISGLGLGVAFSYLDRIADLEQVCRQVPAHLLAEFEQGLSFGWEARQLADRELFDRHAAALPPEVYARVANAVADVHRIRDGLPRDSDKGDFYVRWRRGLVEARRAAPPLFPPSSARRNSL
jgi:hypothetical protein